MPPVPELIQTVSGLDDLYKIARELPEVERQSIYAYHEEKDEQSKLPYRESLWIEDNPVADVSTREDQYHIFQYGDVIETVAETIEQYNDILDVVGRVTVSPSRHKMSAQLEFDGVPDVKVGKHDRIRLGIMVQAGHSELHPLAYDIVGVREPCDNEMTGFISQFHYEQSHQDPLQEELVHDAVDAIVSDPDIVEQRLFDARQEEFVSVEEAIIVLMDRKLYHFLDDPIDSLDRSLREETTGTKPSLYETYNAATRTLTHEVSNDTPQYRVDQGQQRAAALLDDGNGQLPKIEELATTAVENRIQSYLAHDNVRQYWDSESETLRQLADQRDIGA